jgi:hypothetical protein
MKRLLLLLLPMFLCGAASFNGTTDGASTTSTVGYGANQISLSYWFLLGRTNVNQMLIESSAQASAVANSNAFYVAYPSGRDEVAIHGTGSFFSVAQTPASIVSPNVWNHRVVVLDRTMTTNRIAIYGNGVPLSLNYTFFNGNSTDAFLPYRLFVGARNNSASLDANGVLQDLAIYAGEVSAAEAYSLGAQRMSPEKVRSAKLLYYWPFHAGENPANSPDLVGGIPVNSGTKSIVQEQAPTFRK